MRLINKYFWHNYFLFFLVCFSTINLQAQIGSWQTYLPYEATRSLTETPNTIFVGTATAPFSLDKTEKSVQTFTRADGFSDLNIRYTAYSWEHGMTLIAYDNANLDVLQNGRITNFSDIKRTNIGTNKRINHIHLDGDLAYLACGFGIVVFDLANVEFKDTYIIGANGGTATVYQVATSETHIMAATERGLLRIAKSNPNPNDFNDWEVQTDLPDGIVDYVGFAYGQFYASMQNMVFVGSGEEDNWLPVYESGNYEIMGLEVSRERLALVEWERESSRGRTTLLQADGTVIHHGQDFLLRPQKAVFTEAGDLWVADFWKGLVQVLGNGGENIIPNGPSTSNVFELAVKDGKLAIAPGARTGSWDAVGSREGVFFLENGGWTTFRDANESLFSGTNDFITTIFHPTQPKVYWGSFGSGLMEYNYESNEFVRYGFDNSSLGGTIGFETAIRVAGLQFDRSGNLWVSNYGAAEPLSVLTVSGEWMSFDVPFNFAENGLFDLVIDDFDRKWILVNRNDGLLVYDHGQDILSAEDDRYRLLRTGAGNGNLPDNEVHSIVKDKDGHIWVGTKNGIGVFYCTFNILEESGCDAIKPLVPITDNRAEPLLENEQVTAIAVDGGNRKWMGTPSGLWLVSEDGTNAIDFFNVDNSPLLDNGITALSIDQPTGEVFIGTNRGLVSFKGEATEGGATHGNVLVYPNPVRPNYDGPIVITELANNATIKITDINGGLIHEMQALGGQAIWDGKDYTGRKASSGVYLIFSSSENGEDNLVTKLLIVN